MAENILEVRHLKKWFKIGNPAIKKVGVSYLHACDDVSFEIRKGEIFGIIGESGSGKSTIGKCVLNLQSSDSGEIIFDRGATLVVSSHNITEIGELCDKAMLLHKGEVIFAKDIDDVREGFEKVQIALPEGELDRSAIENAGVEVLSFKKLGRISTVVAKGEKADITAKLSALSPAVLELVPLTLEEIFIYEMEVRGYAVSEE